jgi:hypothetical protein
VAVAAGCAFALLAIVLWLAGGRAPAPPRTPAAASPQPAPALTDQPTAVVVDAPAEKPLPATTVRKGERGRKDVTPRRRDTD